MMKMTRRKKMLTSVLVVALLVSSSLLLFLPSHDDEQDRGASLTSIIEFSEIIRPTSDVQAQWAPSGEASNYLCIDETTAGGDGTTTYVIADTTDEQDHYGMSDMSEEDRGDATEIDSVTIWAWAERGGTGTNDFQLGVRISTTNYLGVQSSTTSTWSNYTHTYTVNPATSAAWTITEVNALVVYITTNDAAPEVWVTQLGAVVPGRQTTWPPTFTSTPDTSAFTGDAYSYISTANESSTFSLYASSGPTYDPTTASVIIRPNGDVSQSNVADYPDTDVYYDKLDETTSGSDSDTTYVNTLSSASQASCYFEMETVSWGSYPSITDLDIGGWIILRGVASDTNTGAGIQPDPGNGASNDNIYYSTLGASYINGTKQYEVNPYTSAEWTTGQIDSIRGYLVDGSTSGVTRWTQYALIVNISYTPAPPEAWFTFTPANATLWGTPGLEDVGDWIISILAVSASGEGSAWSNFTITVAEPWSPTFTSTPDTSVIGGYGGYEYNYSYTTNETCTYDVTITPANTGVGGSDTVYAEAQFGWYSVGSYHYWYLAAAAGGQGWMRFDIAGAIGEDATITGVSLFMYSDGTGPTGYARICESAAFDGVGGEGEHSSGVESPTAPGTQLGSLLVGTAGWREFTNAMLIAFVQETYDSDGNAYLIADDGESVASTLWNYLDGTTWAGAYITYLEVDYEFYATEWLSWDSVDDFIWGTPTAGDIGSTVDVSIEATNDIGGVSWQNFTIDVTDGWVPTFTSSPDTTGSTEILYTYTATCNETVTWPVDDDFTTNASWLHWGQANHTVYGTPSLTDTGPFYVNITANSTAGHGIGFQNWTITVGVPDAVSPTAIAAWGYLSTGEAEVDPPDSNLNFTDGSTGLTVHFYSYSYDNIGITNWTWNFTGAITMSVYYEYPFYGRLTTVGVYDVNLTVRDSSDNIGWDTFSFTLVQGDILYPSAVDAIAFWNPSGDSDINSVIDDPNPYYFADSDENTTYVTGTVDDDTGNLILDMDDWYLAGEYDLNVTLNVWALDDTAVGSFRGGLYYGGNGYYETFTTDATWRNLSYTWDLCPWTTAEWTTSDINSTQMYFRDIIGGTQTRISAAWLTISHAYLDTEDPVANAGPDQSVFTNVTMSFNGALSTDNIGIVNYTWSFTYDGGTEYLYGVAPTFIFEFTGSYIVTLVVLDAESNDDDDTVTITVSVPAGPSESFISPTTIFTGMAILGLVGMFLVPIVAIKFGDEDEHMLTFLLAVIGFAISFGFFLNGITTLGVL